MIPLQVRAARVAEYDAFTRGLSEKYGIDHEHLPFANGDLKRMLNLILAVRCVHEIVRSDQPTSELRMHIATCLESTLVLMSLGIVNPARVMLRQSIELTFKCLYFDSHPREYLWTFTEPGLKELSTTDFKDFLRRDSGHRKCKQYGEQLISEVYGDYSELSRWVHVHNANYALFAPGTEAVDETVRCFKRCVEAQFILTACFDWELITENASVNERLLLISTVSRGKRRELIQTLL